MKYRRNGEVVDVVQWNGYNIEELKEFVGDALIINEMKYSCVDTGEKFSRISALYIKTLIGTVAINKYDCVVKNQKGQFCPLGYELFLENFERVEDK